MTVTNTTYKGVAILAATSVEDAILKGEIVSGKTSDDVNEIVGSRAQQVCIINGYSGTDGYKFGNSKRKAYVSFDENGTAHRVAAANLKPYQGHKANGYVRGFASVSCFR